MNKYFLGFFIGVIISGLFISLEYISNPVIKKEIEYVDREIFVVEKETEYIDVYHTETIYIKEVEEGTYTQEQLEGVALEVVNIMMSLTETDEDYFIEYDEETETVFIFNKVEDRFVLSETSTIDELIEFLTSRSG
ncbi:MAG: hypothetical protein ACOCWM_05765 [Cyclobacteriaceae bacterium]